MKAAVSAAARLPAVIDGCKDTPDAASFEEQAFDLADVTGQIGDRHGIAAPLVRPEAVGDFDYTIYIEDADTFAREFVESGGNLCFAAAAHRPLARPGLRRVHDGRDVPRRGGN